MLKSPSAKLTPVKNETGFTFIELLIAVVIMALILGVGFANYRGFQQRQQLIAAARAFKSDLIYARQQALSGTKPAGCVVLDWYRVKRADLDSYSYEIHAFCDAGAANVTVKTVTTEVQLSAFNVDFKVLGRGTNLSSDLTITLTDDTGTATVVVTPGGDVN
jgi:prepilin-type N-terminal cleavage/methylation domain-containing protein